MGWNGELPRNVSSAKPWAQPGGRPLDLLERGRFGDTCEAEARRRVRVELVGADDRVHREASLASARRDLGDRLSMRRLPVEPALADDDRPHRVEARREPDELENARGPRLEPRPKRRPQSAGEPTAGAGARNSAGIAWVFRGEGPKPRRDALHRVRRGALLRREDRRRVLEPVRDIAQHRQLRVTEPTRGLDRSNRARAAVAGHGAADRQQYPLRARIHRGGDQRADADGGGRLGVAARDLDQVEADDLGRLDQSGEAAVEDGESRLSRLADRVLYERVAELGLDRLGDGVERALAAVGNRAAVRVEA